MADTAGEEQGALAAGKIDEYQTRSRSWFGIKGRKVHAFKA